MNKKRKGDFIVFPKNTLKRIKNDEIKANWNEILLEPSKPSSSLLPFDRSWSEKQELFETQPLIRLLLKKLDKIIIGDMTLLKAQNCYENRKKILDNNYWIKSNFCNFSTFTIKCFKFLLFR